MSAPPRGWNAPDPNEPPGASHLTDQQEWARLHAATFGSGPGRVLLEKYHALLVDRAYGGPDVSEAALRFNEARRALILDMQRLVRAGQERSPQG